MITCCEKDSALECLAQTYEPFIRNTLKAGLMKLIFTTLSTRNLKKILMALRVDIPRFGATFGLCSALYHVTICYIHRLKRKFNSIQVSEKAATFIAAMIGSLSLRFGL